MEQPVKNYKYNSFRKLMDTVMTLSAFIGLSFCVLDDKKSALALGFIVFLLWCKLDDINHNLELQNKQSSEPNSQEKK